MNGHGRDEGMRIEDLRHEDTALIEQVAAMLVDAFAKHHPDAWPDHASARAEVTESFEEGRISRVALDDDETALGWIGGIPQYDGRVFELHPLVVRPDRQERGIGRALVYDFEERRSEEHTSELQSPVQLVCRLLLEKKNKQLSQPVEALSR